MTDIRGKQKNIGSVGRKLAGRFDHFVITLKDIMGPLFVFLFSTPQNNLNNRWSSVIQKFLLSILVSNCYFRLKSKVAVLENSNRSLLDQVNELQKIIAQKTSGNPGASCVLKIPNVVLSNCPNKTLQQKESLFA